MKNIVTANEELNRWCGTENINYYEGDTALGFLFKYAVPNVEYVSLSWQPYLIGAKVSIGTVKIRTMAGVPNRTIVGGREVKEPIYEDPALALFWAIFEALKNVTAKD